MNKPRVQRPTWHRMPWLLPFALLAFSAHADSPESDAADTMTHLPPPPEFVIPDVQDSTLKAADYDDDRFSVKFGAVLLLDQTFFDQDSASIAQVGEQEDKFEVRSARLMARGDLKLFGAWSYQVSSEYKGFGGDPDKDPWQLTDLWFALNLHGDQGKITFGKQKETFAYEMVGDAANLPQQERLMSPFFVSRNIGVTWSRTAFDKRASVSVGWYNDVLTSGDSLSDSGNDFSARLTALPVLEDDGARYLHLAASTRYYGGDNDKLRYKGKPESNVADNFVDTGDIAADHAWQMGLEALWADHYYSVLAEYLQAWVRSPSAGDPEFKGFYVTASWVPNGLPRPYDRRVAYSRRVPVTQAWGSLEYVVRYGRLDLDDAGVHGGTLDKWYAGVNWWATKRWKAGIGYGNATLDRFGLEGDTKILLTRLQWIY